MKLIFYLHISYFQTLRTKKKIKCRASGLNCADISSILQVSWWFVKLHLPASLKLYSPIPIFNLSVVVFLVLFQVFYNNWKQCVATHLPIYVQTRHHWWRLTSSEDRLLWYDLQIILQVTGWFFTCFMLDFHEEGKIYCRIFMTCDFFLSWNKKEYLIKIPCEVTDSEIIKYIYKKKVKYYF